MLSGKPYTFKQTSETTKCLIASEAKSRIEHSENYVFYIPNNIAFKPISKLDRAYKFESASF